MLKLDRRHFISMSAAIGATTAADSAIAQNPADVPIIETTIHLYDPTRPQGAPYKQDPTGVSAAKYRKDAAPGVIGAVAIECSPWLEDNLWLLEACAQDTIMVGCIGNLRPEAEGFSEYLGRFSKNPLYRGIRYGNIWGYNLVEQVSNPIFLAGLRMLAEADLVLEICNPKLDLLQAAIRINDTIPHLRIVVDHLAGFYPTVEESAAVQAVLQEYAHRPQIYGKISAFDLGLGDKAPPLTLAIHKDRLDGFYQAFGEDRLLGGAWTPQTIALCRAWLASKGTSATNKFFWQNSARIYKWIPREPNQPRLL